MIQIRHNIPRLGEIRKRGVLCRVRMHNRGYSKKSCDPMTEVAGGIIGFVAGGGIGGICGLGLFAFLFSSGEKAQRESEKSTQANWCFRTVYGGALAGMHMTMKRCELQPKTRFLTLGIGASLVALRWVTRDAGDSVL